MLVGKSHLALCIPCCRNPEKPSTVYKTHFRTYRVGMLCSQLNHQRSKLPPHKWLHYFTENGLSRPKRNTEVRLMLNEVYNWAHISSNLGTIPVPRAPELFSACRSCKCRSFLVRNRRVSTGPPTDFKPGEYGAKRHELSVFIAHT